MQRRSASAAVLLVFALLALFGPAVAPYAPRLATGVPLLPPGPGHLLGTNDIGQDVLSEWLWGARSSLAAAVGVALLSIVLSWTVGVAAAVWRRAEEPLMALTDLLLALPGIPLYMLVVALLGPSQRNVILTLGVLSWPAFARVVRARVIGLRGAPYVEASRAMGATSSWIVWRHIFPGTLGLLPAKLMLTVRFAVFAEATLSFLGLGDPAAKSWGVTLGWAFADPLLFAGDTWAWRVLPPALSIVLVVLATTWFATDLELDTAPTSRAMQPAHGSSESASAPRARRFWRRRPVAASS